MASPTSNKAKRRPPARKIPANDDKSPLGTIEINKKTYACGLFWQTLSGTGANRKKSIKEIAAEQYMHLYLTRNKNGQVGFGNYQNGVKKGQQSFASMLAGGLALSNIKSFIYIGQFGEKWVYVSCFNGNITLDGDEVGDEAKIKSTFARNIDNREWGLIIAPPEWEVEGSVTRNILDDIAKNTKDAHNLNDIKKSYWKLVLLTAMTMSVVGGAYWYQQKLEAEEQARIQQEAEIENQKRIRSGGDLPNPMEFIKKCESAIFSIPPYPGGWPLTSAVCMKDAVTMKWSREDQSLVKYFKLVVPNAVVTPDAKMASLKIDFPQQPSIAQNLNGVTIEQRFQEIVDTAAIHSIDIKTNILNDAGIKRIEWSIEDTSLKPSEIVPWFDHVGFKVIQIDMSYKDGIEKWSMKGSQYGQ